MLMLFINIVEIMWIVFSIEKVNYHLNIIELANNDDKKIICTELTLQ